MRTAGDATEVLCADDVDDADDPVVAVI
jgi:hypothetical protein